MKTLLLPLVLAAPAAAQATFTVVQSGSFPTANADASAIVGTDSQGAFLWTVTGGNIRLGEQSGVGVSEDGQSVLGQITDPVTGENVAGIWTAATGWQSLGGFGSSCGSDATNPYELSGDAQTAVGLGWVGCQGRAFRYTNTFGMQQLPMQTNNNSRASAISVDGNWIGGWEEDATGARRACVWDSNLNQSFILVSSTNANGAGEVYGFSHDGAYAVGTEGGGLHLGAGHQHGHVPRRRPRRRLPRQDHPALRRRGRGTRRRHLRVRPLRARHPLDPLQRLRVPGRRPHGRRRRHERLGDGQRLPHQPGRQRPRGRRPPGRRLRQQRLHRHPRRRGPRHQLLHGRDELHRRRRAASRASAATSSPPTTSPSRPAACPPASSPTS